MAQILCLSYWVNGIKANYLTSLSAAIPAPAIAFSIDGSGLRIRGETRERYEPSWILVTQAKTVYWLEQEMAGRIMVLLVRGCGSERIKMGCYADDEELRWIARQLLPLVESGQASARLTIRRARRARRSASGEAASGAGRRGNRGSGAGHHRLGLSAELLCRSCAWRRGSRSLATICARSFRRDIGESISSLYPSSPHGRRSGAVAGHCDPHQRGGAP